jgi:hypothetical protein
VVLESRMMSLSFITIRGHHPGSDIPQYLTDLTPDYSNMFPLLLLLLLPEVLARDRDYGDPLDSHDFIRGRDLKNENGHLWKYPDREVKQDDGDILPPDDNGQTSAISSTDNKWNTKDGDLIVVPYTIAKGFDPVDRGVIAMGMEDIMDKTCITFTHKTDRDRDWLHFDFAGSAGECRAQVGRQGGEQVVYLNPEVCLRRGANNPGKYVSVFSFYLQSY